MWISTDPALGEYIPKAPIDEEAKEYNQNLPGLGGVFNPINGNLYHYAANNPVRYTNQNGRKEKKGLTWGILNLLLGKDNVNRIWNDSMYDGFANFSDTILHEAIEAPCGIISDASSVVGIYAIATGNVPLAAGAEITGNAADSLILGSKVLKAYNSGKKSDWIDAASDAANLGFGAFVSFSIKGKYADVRVTQSSKNGGYYQKGHKGRLSNSEGFKKKLIQELAPELGKEFATKIADTVINDMKMQINKEKGANDE